MILERMALTLSDNQRVEIRGFGSFSLHYRAARVGRNPKTGDAVDLRGKYVPYFKPGKELRTRGNNGIKLNHPNNDLSAAKDSSPLA